MKKLIPEFEFSAEQLNNIRLLANKCGLLEDTVKILYGRGIDSEEKIEAFIHPSKSHFVSPFSMSGMSEAVELITTARDEGWTVAVYGDYDADGICASTIMTRALADFGIDAVVYVPERKDGYGLNRTAIDALFEEHFPQLFITVDCGISCAEEVEYIKEQGAEVIVTDHHELPDKIPDCICINPKFDDGYPFDNLCGAGVALKVAVALNGEKGLKYLDFAAIATVADSVPLTGENRDIVAEGLKLINSDPRSCYSKFFVKNESYGAVNAQTIAFTLAPRINAAGRMGDSKSALRLFTSSDEKEIFDLCAKLSAYNLERQKYCDELYADAKRKIKEKGAYGNVIMLYDESWNTGFVGIVAARIADEYARPALLFVKNGSVLKGSARSVENVNIFEALKACEEYISEFGGHSQAAGVNVEIENFDRLEEKLNAYLTENYRPSDFEHTVYISGALNESNFERFAKEIELLEPCGVGNRRPMFTVDLQKADSRPLKYLSPHLSVKDKRLELMYFGGAKFNYLLNSSAPKCCTFEYNISSFRGKEYVKGYLRDIILDRDAGAYCATEIAVNNILTLSGTDVDCNTEYRTREEIDNIIKNSDAHGNLYIASDYSSLSKYKNLENVPVELFTLTSGSVSDTVLVSPRADTDLSQFKTVIFLDSIPSKIKFPSLSQKTVIICSDVCGYNYIKALSCEREKLLKVFSALVANVGGIDGADGAEIALGYDLSESPLQTVFAVEVFRQLSLLDFKDGKFTLYRGVKSELSKSQLFNTVQSKKNEDRT